MKSNAQERSKRKPYQKPNLRVYGDIHTLTRTIGMGKVFDGKGNKTQ